MPPPRQPKKSNLALGIVLALVVLGIIAALVKAIGAEQKADAEASSTVHVPSTWATLPDPTGAKASTTAPTPTAAPSFTRTATVTPSPDFPAGLDARCSQAPADLVEKISAKLKNPNHRIVHAVLVTPPAGTPYIGASVVAADGLMVERSDVWVNTKSRGMTAATSGARRTTDLPKATDVIELDMSTEEFQAADMCAWKWAQASGYK